MKYFDPEKYLRKYIKRHRLEVHPDLHIVTNGNFKGLLGRYCHKDYKIELNRYHLKHAEINPKFVKDTIRHELAHHMTHLEGGRGHGDIFKKWAKYFRCFETNFKYGTMSAYAANHMRQERLLEKEREEFRNLPKDEKGRIHFIVKQ